jgi:hypothetical protein
VLLLLMCLVQLLRKHPLPLHLLPLLLMQMLLLMGLVAAPPAQQLWPLQAPEGQLPLALAAAVVTAAVAAAPQKAVTVAHAAAALVRAPVAAAVARFVVQAARCLAALLLRVLAEAVVLLQPQLHSCQTGQLLLQDLLLPQQCPSWPLLVCQQSLLRWLL